MSRRNDRPAQKQGPGDNGGGMRKMFCENSLHFYAGRAFWEVNIWEGRVVVHDVGRTVVIQR